MIGPKRDSYATALLSFPTERFRQNYDRIFRKNYQATTPHSGRLDYITDTKETHDGRSDRHDL